MTEAEQALAIELGIGIRQRQGIDTLYFVDSRGEWHVERLPTIEERVLWRKLLESRSKVND